MLSVGCTIKYRIKDVNENPDLTPEQKKTGKLKNLLVLTILYTMIAALMLCIVVLFTQLPTLSVS